jgi:pimeloyl-ACP methyl ester carboxylesterase
MPTRKKSRASKSGQLMQSHFAQINGVRLHYLAAGKGSIVIPLHGYAETSHMWRPLITELAGTHTVISPDLRGAGKSSHPAAGYTKTELAQDIHALVHRLGCEHTAIVGHDIMYCLPHASNPAGHVRHSKLESF